MKHRIALGLGDNVDYEIVWDSRVIDGLITHYGIRAAEIAPDLPIRSERDLVISILSYVKSSRGGERTLDTPEVLDEFASRFEYLVSLGGTSVRAAIAMHKLGYTSVIHLVTVNDDVRRLLPPDCDWVCSSEQDSLYPHVIVQFGENEHIHAGDIDLRTTRANRIIYHRDIDNRILVLTERFSELITEARVILISSFNALHDEAILRDRIATVKRIISHLPQGAQVLIEGAAYYNPDFAAIALDELSDRIDIFSLNEDELQGHVGRAVDMLDAEQVVRAVADLQRRFPIPTIVVHSMYWALAYGAQADRLAGALKGGVTMATTRYCYGDEFSEKEYRETEALPPNPQGAQACAAMEKLLPGRLCCVPVALVSPARATTIGLGDAFVGGFLPPLSEIA